MTSPTPKDDAVLVEFDRAVLAAPLPTDATLRKRKNVLLQTFRFGVLNVRTLRMVLKGHH